MNVEEAVLQAIHDNPTDETSWRVLADWLEENGCAGRAEMVRLQLALRDLHTDEARAPLEKRFQKLLRAGVKPCVPTLTNSVGMRLALIPPGAFWIGSPEDEEGRYADESPRRLLELSRPFYLGVYPVTQQEFRAVTGRNPSAFAAAGRLKDAVAGKDTSRFPVEDLDWPAAAAFCVSLGALPAERKARRAYRLPTEVEWEYACRGGASMTTPFPWGKRATRNRINFKPSGRNGARPRSLGRTNEAGAYLPNGFGLYDMLGGAWEWCADWYASEAYAQHAARDPQPAAEGDRRNARGGTYNLEQRRVRTADRSSFEPDYHDSDCGFRVLCEWAPRKK
jgi:uncharacterized protein (TIGR02996 family)